MNPLVKSAVVCAALAVAVSACGDNLEGGPLAYTDPPDGGALRLVKNPRASPTAMLLDFVVGDGALTGFSAGFDLPLDLSKVRLGAFTPGTALDPGSAPIAAAARIPTAGPLAGMLVAGQSQKATASASDARLAPGTVLFTIELGPVLGAAPGVIFDGTAGDFRLPSGGLRDKAGTTVVDQADVSIGKLVTK